MIELSDGVTETQILQQQKQKIFARENIISGNDYESVIVTLPQTVLFLISLFIFIFIISANMSPFGLRFSQMIFHTKTR